MLLAQNLSTAQTFFVSECNLQECNIPMLLLGILPCLGVAMSGDVTMLSLHLLQSNEYYEYSLHVFQHILS